MEGAGILDAMPTTEGRAALNAARQTAQQGTLQ